MSSSGDVPAQPLALCYGTRPQVIKASLLMEALSTTWPLLTIDTGQHYDYELNALLYEQLGVRAPDILLGVGSSDHATQTAAILLGAATAFQQHRPWAVVVIGDTNSTLGCALAAAKLRLPVIHVEAGLRSDDIGMAEEINRRAVDAIAAVLCAPSEHSAARLRDEAPLGRVHTTGDVARDVLERNATRAPDVRTLADWPLPDDAPFVFATLHRAELVDDPRRLAEAIDALSSLQLPVVMAVHPRTRAMLERSGVAARVPAHVHLRPPLGYLEALACTNAARVVVTDSGGVQREAYWLGTPCVTVRAETEWLETVECGANVLASPAAVGSELREAVRRQLRTARASWSRDAYGDGGAAAAIRAAIREIYSANASTIAS